MTNNDKKALAHPNSTILFYKAYRVIQTIYAHRHTVRTYLEHSWDSTGLEQFPFFLRGYTCHRLQSMKGRKRNGKLKVIKKCFSPLSMKDVSSLKRRGLIGS